MQFWERGPNKLVSEQIGSDGDGWNRNVPLFEMGGGILKEPQQGQMGRSEPIREGEKLGLPVSIRFLPKGNVYDRVP